MSKWTTWIKIAKGNEYYLDNIIYTGPCCYQLGIRQWLIEEIRIVYVGETNCEKVRISSYAKHGSHLRNVISKHLKMGHALYFRSQAKKSKKAAKKMQDSLLSKYDHDWNIR